MSDCFSTKQCFQCSNYIGRKKCLAFVDEIPIELFTDEFIHTKPFKGDNEIRFEPIEDLHNSNKR